MTVIPSTETPTFFIITVVLYAASAIYFAGVMVRLMLTLTPIVCVFAAIAFSHTLTHYLKEEDVNKSESTQQETNTTKVAVLTKLWTLLVAQN